MSIPHKHTHSIHSHINPATCHTSLRIQSANVSPQQLAQVSSIHHCISSVGDLSLLLVLIQGQRTWRETGLAALKKPKCQTMTCRQLPAALIWRGLDDAYLIVSLENLVQVSKRFPMSVLRLLGSIIAAREERTELALCATFRVALKSH